MGKRVIPIKIVSLISLPFEIKGITNTVFRYPAGKLADRIGYKIPFIIAYVLMSPIYSVLSEGRNFYILAAAMAIFGMLHAMRAVTEWGLLGISTSPKKNSSLTSAYLSTMSNIDRAMGAVAAGVITLIYFTPTIFKLASLILLSGFFIPFVINQNPATRKSQKSYM